MASWSALPTPPFAVAICLLLVDGRLIAFEAGWASIGTTRVALLYPGPTGGYTDGTWQEVAPMTRGRLYFGSHVMADNEVFVSGGEYSTDSPAFTDTAEIYGPLTNTWTSIGHLGMTEGDAPSCMLPDDSVIILDLNNITNKRWSEGGGVVSAAANPIGGPDEAGMILMQNDLAITVGFIGHGTSACAYNYASDTWSMTSALPVDAINTANGEIGPVVGLYDGRVLFIGGTGVNQIYDPGTDTWSVVANSPILPTTDQGCGNDSPACVMPSGEVLLTLGPYDSGGGFPSGTYFYIYNPAADTFTSVAPPSSLWTSFPTFVISMLMLPTGQVLVSHQGAEQAVFTPDGVPDPAWKPTISSFTPVSGLDYLLTGTQLCGLTQGAYYGDDWQTATNQPICFLDDGLGNRYYCYSGNVSTRSIAPGRSGTVTVALPSSLPPGSYNLYLVANGVASDPWPIAGGVITASDSLGMIPV